MLVYTSASIAIFMNTPPDIAGIVGWDIQLGPPTRDRDRCLSIRLHSSLSRIQARTEGTGRPVGLPWGTSRILVRDRVPGALDGVFVALLSGGAAFQEGRGGGR